MDTLNYAKIADKMIDDLCTILGKYRKGKDTDCIYRNDDKLHHVGNISAPSLGRAGEHTVETLFRLCNAQVLTVTANHKHVGDRMVDGACVDIKTIRRNIRQECFEIKGINRDKTQLVFALLPIPGNIMAVTFEPMKTDLREQQDGSYTARISIKPRASNQWYGHQLSLREAMQDVANFTGNTYLYTQIAEIDATVGLERFALELLIQNAYREPSETSHGDGVFSLARSVNTSHKGIPWEDATCNMFKSELDVLSYKSPVGSVEQGNLGDVRITRADGSKVWFENKLSTTKKDIRFNRIKQAAKFDYFNGLHAASDTRLCMVIMPGDIVRCRDYVGVSCYSASPFNRLAIPFSASKDNTHQFHKYLFTIEEGVKMLHKISQGYVLR